MPTNNYQGLLSFINNNNICYFNSCLQLILSSQKFIQDTSNTNKEDSIILKSIKDIIKYKQSPEKPVYQSLIFKTQLSEYNNFFKETGQQDAHECFVNIIDTLHNQTLTKDNSIPQHIHTTIYNDHKLLKGNTKQGNDMFFKYFKDEGYSPISKFVGQIRTELKCQVCDNSRYIYETINNIGLSLPQEKEVDIIDCFINYIRTENLEEPIECETCKKKTNTTKTVNIWRFPEILVINLKRYTQTPFGHYTRNNCLVDFSIDMNFKSSNTNNILKYKLKSIVNHIGFNPLGGHYTTFISNTNKNYDCDWIHIDDSNIYKTKENELVSSSAYILLYELV